jgi:hypothetical protein
MPRPAFWLVLVALTFDRAVAQQAEPAALSGALRPALARALPFPEAQPDGMPAGGVTEPLWIVRWPAAGDLRVDVLANPLNPGNHERALKAEAEIQRAAMASQRKSQADYEQALRDFQRTGTVGDIREISLRDDGVAGERYDAESQLTIRAAEFGDAHAFTVATSRLPEALPASGGPAVIVRVAANTYREPGTAGDSEIIIRFCAEQAWVYFGALTTPVITRRSDDSAAVSVARAPGASRGVVVSISGNVELVSRVLQQADWGSLKAHLGG